MSYGTPLSYGILFTVYTHSGNWHTHSQNKMECHAWEYFYNFFSLFTEVEDLGEGLETHPPSLLFSTHLFSELLLSFPLEHTNTNSKKKKETLRAQ